MTVPEPAFQTVVIRVHPQAPAKPAWGAPCNGCGVCCLTEPCPLGVLLSRRRQGACDALRWVDDDATSVYRCGVLLAPKAVLQQALPAWLAWSLPAWLWVLRWGSARWISAGKGCDCSLVVETPPQTAGADDAQSSP